MPFKGNEYSSSGKHVSSREILSNVKISSDIKNSGSTKDKEMSDYHIKSLDFSKNSETLKQSCGNYSSKTWFVCDASSKSDKLEKTEKENQISGDIATESTSEDAIKYPIETDISLLTYSVKPRDISEIHDSRICVRCQRSGLCNCKLKVNTQQYLNISKSGPSKLRFYPKEIPEIQISKKPDDYLKKNVNVENKNMIFFWLQFFGISVILAGILYYLSYLSQIIIWNQVNVIQTFLCGGLFCIGFCWLVLTNFCHRTDLGYKFSTLDYIFIVSCTTLITVPWTIVSLAKDLGVMYCILNFFLATLCILSKIKEPPKMIKEPLRKMLFIFHVITSYFVPAIHYSLHQDKIHILFSICAWFAIFIAIYAAAMLMNTFCNHSQIYMDPSHNNLLLEVLQVFQMVYLALSIIQFVNIFQLSKIKYE